MSGKKSVRKNKPVDIVLLFEKLPEFAEKFTLCK
jgi:hypothetical protein